jgi:hypothetical protein
MSPSIVIEASPTLQVPRSQSELAAQLRATPGNPEHVSVSGQVPKLQSALLSHRTNSAEFEQRLPSQVPVQAASSVHVVCGRPVHRRTPHDPSWQPESSMHGGGDELPEHIRRASSRTLPLSLPLPTPSIGPFATMASPVVEAVMGPA